MSPSLPDWLRPAVERVLGDMQEPTPLALEASYTRNDRSGYWGVLRCEAPNGESFELEVPDPANGSETQLLVRLAEELPWYVSELQQSWGESRPICPGHTHPAAPAERDGTAWWVCPREGVPLGRIGALGRPPSQLADEPPWNLPVAGFEVARVEFAYPFDIIAAATAARRFKVQINGRFEYRNDAGQTTTLDVEHDAWRDLTPLLALREDKVARAHVSQSSVLTVEFTSGRQITVRPTHDRYEAWEANGPGFKVVDGPALWTGSAWR
jgi:hypothetical protein